MQRTFFVPLFTLFLASACLAQKPEPAPAAVKKGDHELRLVRVGKTFQGLRLNTRSGEAWLLVVDRFEKIPETAPVPPGDYDVTLMTDDNDWMAFRIERQTGLTWMLRNRMWIKFKEAGEMGQ